MDETTTVDLKALRAPFPAELTGKLPRVTCGDCSDRRKTCDRHQKSKCSVCDAYVSTQHIHLDYVGHADVTSRLLEVDPEWNWEPKAEDEHGLPVFDADDNGAPVGLWIRLTVGGVTRLGYGSVPSGQPDAVKVLIGDALRNAAMRFGVALDLWAKGDRADPAAENATASGGQAVRGRQAAGGAFANATTARPPANGNGSQRAQVSRPAAPAAASAPAAVGEPDPDAQEFADQAHEARALGELEDIHKRARERGKVAAVIRNPSTGNAGKLALYIDWRRKQLADIDKAMRELGDAASAAGFDGAAIEEHVKTVLGGVSIEDASAAELRQAAKALRERAA